MSDEKIDAVEPDVETEGDITIVEPPQSADQMDAVIAISKRIDEYAKAHDTIVGAVVKRSYPGDWVVHKKGGDKDEDQKANMGAAAAERMAAFVGITESNWSDGGKEWSEDHKHYTWAYEADFTFGRRTIHVISRVGTRDKFFGKEKGSWKPLEEVQEDDIKKAAFRACRKEGVRTLLGLRNVPVIKLKELGFDVTKINFVGFEEKGKALSADAKTVSAETGLAKKTITIKEMKNFPWAKPEEKDKNGKVVKAARSGLRVEVWDIEGVKWTLWANDVSSERYLALADAMNAHDPIDIQFQTKKTEKGESYEIAKVSGVDDL